MPLLTNVELDELTRIVSAAMEVTMARTAREQSDAIDRLRVLVDEHLDRRPDLKAAVVVLRDIYGR
jgi:hypothetical protein